MGGDDQQLSEYVCRSLKRKRYLIVLDDVWDTNVWDDLQLSFPEERLSSKGKGSRVLLTTRLEEVAYSAQGSNCHQMRFLSEEESWYLLRQKVFGEEPCPPQLVKAGKKIAEKCEGLPLAIITISRFLSKEEKTPEFWRKVAENKNSVFNYAYDQMLEVLFPSYNYLPQYLKPCFLYLGVFPQSYEIPCSKLIELWSAEGFLEPNPSTTLEDYVVECLDELVSKSVVMVRQRSYNNKTKACGLHSVFWHLSNKVAREDKFFLVLNRRRDGLGESIKSQRRLCIHNNVLFGIKDVYDSMASISTARSLLCTGPPHPYPIPICSDLMLLRVLHALTLHFYEFPMEVLKLVQLRYLALTYNGEIPHSISSLLNLQFLIVRRHLCIIKLYEGEPCLPIDLWDMKELKHLRTMRSNLPDRPFGAFLPNLLKLSEVGTHSCSEDILEGLPSLKKLGIQIEQAPNGVEPLSCFDHISHLNKLESLKCIIVNPILSSEILTLPVTLSSFPSGLNKLTLSGMGYPWEDMKLIGSLKNLEVLKLRCYAFRGPKWETNDEEFWRLRTLVIEETDVVHWVVEGRSLPKLKYLFIKHCYNLQEIPRVFLLSLETVELVDCNPLAVTCARQMVEESNLEGFISVRVYSSCN